MARKPACPECGRRKWRKEAGTGTLTCPNGHILQGYRNETIEAGDFGPHAMRKRGTKSIRATTGKKSGANPILYHGDRARYHYFQCLQVLLRMQIAKLTKLWKLSSDFEIVCRDTWALHLSLLSFPPPAEPFFHVQDQEDSQTPDFAQKAKALDRIEKETKRDRNTDEAEGVSESSDTGSSSSAPDDEGDDSDEESTKMDDLVREMEAENSESDEEDRGQYSQVKPIPSSKHRKGMRWRGDDDSPAATICVLVHACWLIRIPVIYKDFISLIETYTLPYLDPTRLFSETLTRHLTKYAKQALSPHASLSIPSAPSLALSPLVVMLISGVVAVARSDSDSLTHNHLSARSTVLRTVRNFLTRAEYGANSLAHREPYGWPPLYAVSKALAQYLELPLTVNTVMTPVLVKKSVKDPAFHKGDSIPPELALIATVVIALKLIYGFDGKQMTPKEDWDPAHTMPALEVYLNHLQTLGISDTESSRRYFSPSCMVDVLQDEDELDLDAYMDFCERALLDRAGRNSKAGNNDLIKEFYAVQSEKHMEFDEGNRSSQRVNLGVDGRIRNDDDVVRVLETTRVMGDELKGEANKEGKAGESYAIYSGQDGFGRVPDEYAIVLSRAVGFSGVSKNDLSVVMERFERRLARRWKQSSSKRGDKSANGTEHDEGVETVV